MDSNLYALEKLAAQRRDAGAVVPVRSAVR
jgi:hypothetical protein